MNDDDPTDAVEPTQAAPGQPPAPNPPTPMAQHPAYPPVGYVPAQPTYGYPPPAGWVTVPTGPYAMAPAGYGVPAKQPASGLYTAAAIINWVVLAIIIVATCGFGLLAAAWYVPMTIFIHKGATDRQRHTALGVCTLLFCNLISGILMLVEDSNRPRFT